MSRSWSDSFRYVVVLSALAACGGTDGSSGDSLPEPAVPLDGDWVASELVLDGTPVSLDPAAPVTMSIDGSEVTGVAACNSYGGTVRRGDDGAFSLEGLAVTEMACEPATVMEIEQAVIAALGTLDRYALTDQLVLTSDDGATSMTLLRAIEGGIQGSWEAVSATIDGGSVTNLGTVAVTMDVGGGRISGGSGCNQYEIAVDVAGDTITFGPRTATEAFCSGPPGEIEGLFTAVTSGTATWTVERDELTLTNGAAVWVFRRTGDEPLASPATTTPDPTSAAAQRVPTVEVRPVGACFAEEGEGPAPDPSMGQEVLPHPAAASRCIVGAAIGPAPVLVPPLTVAIDPGTGIWITTASVRSASRAAWNQAVLECFERVEPCASGQIAVVIDGVIASAPTVVAPEIPGDVGIPGGSEAEALGIAHAIDRNQPSSG